MHSKFTFKLDYLHKEGLPHWLSPFDPSIGYLSKFGILGLHKFLPYRSWFRNELVNFASNSIADSNILSLPFWNSNIISGIVTNHILGRKNYTREINAILTLDAVDRLLIRGFSEYRNKD